LRLTIFATLAVAAAGVAGGTPSVDSAGGTPSVDSEAVTAAGLVQEYNSRPIGSPGVRRVRLEMRNEGRVARIFDIVHAWQESTHEVRSVVLLERPDGLRGTSYLLVEDQQLPQGVEVFLFLPAGQRRVLKITPSRFDEGLLGSDFGYNDLLWRLPIVGRQLSLGSRTTLGTQAVSEVDVEVVGAGAREGTRWGLVQYYFSRGPTLLVGADYFADSAAVLRRERPAKQLRVSGWSEKEGAWTPDRMVMSAGPGRDSVLTLTAAPSVRPPMFTNRMVPDALPELGRWVEDGRLDSSLGGAAP
jgi:hypothetical protein